MSFIDIANRLQKEQKKVRILTPGTSSLIGWVAGVIVEVFVGGNLPQGWYLTVEQEDRGRVTRTHVPMGAIMRIEEEV